MTCYVDIYAQLDAESIDRFGVMFAQLNAGQRRLVLDIIRATPCPQIHDHHGRRA
jgi:hypothetical protein